MIQLGRMEQLEEDTNGRDYRADVCTPGERRCSHFSERIRRINTHRLVGFMIVSKVVLVCVSDDIKLLSDELAVDCVKQRVKFTCGRG